MRIQIRIWIRTFGHRSHPTQKDHSNYKDISCAGFESGFGFKAAGFGFGFKKMKMDSDSGEFGFETGGFGFEVPGFAHHC